jgi:hypothetical protein
LPSASTAAQNVDAGAQETDTIAPPESSTAFDQDEPLKIKSLPLVSPPMHSDADAHEIVFTPTESRVVLDDQVPDISVNKAPPLSPAAQKVDVGQESEVTECEERLCAIDHEPWAGLYAH